MNYNSNVGRSILKRVLVLIVENHFSITEKVMKYFDQWFLTSCLAPCQGQDSSMKWNIFHFLFLNLEVVKKNVSCNMWWH